LIPGLKELECFAKLSDVLINFQREEDEMPAFNCKGIWSSFIQPNGSTTETDDGLMIILTENSSGVLQCHHADPVGSITGGVIGLCQDASPHLSIQRIEVVGGVTYEFQYWGKIVTPGPPTVVVKGKYKRIRRTFEKILSNQDGDWTAQKPPITFVSARKSSGKAAGSKSRPSSPRKK